MKGFFYDTVNFGFDYDWVDYDSVYIQSWYISKVSGLVGYVLTTLHQTFPYLFPNIKAVIDNNNMFLYPKTGVCNHIYDIVTIIRSNDKEKLNKL